MSCKPSVCCVWIIREIKTSLYIMNSCSKNYAQYIIVKQCESSLCSGSGFLKGLPFSPLHFCFSDLFFKATLVELQLCSASVAFDHFAKCPSELPFGCVRQQNISKPNIPASNHNLQMSCAGVTKTVPAGTMLPQSPAELY